jgi:hypothetical protein
VLQQWGRSGGGCQWSGVRGTRSRGCRGSPGSRWLTAQSHGGCAFRPRAAKFWHALGRWLRRTSVLEADATRARRTPESAPDPASDPHPRASAHAVHAGDHRSNPVGVCVRGMGPRAATRAHAIRDAPGYLSKPGTADVRPSARRGPAKAHRRPGCRIVSAHISRVPGRADPGSGEPKSLGRVPR